MTDRKKGGWGGWDVCAGNGMYMTTDLEKKKAEKHTIKQERKRTKMRDLSSLLCVCHSGGWGNSTICTQLGLH